MKKINIYQLLPVLLLLLWGPGRHLMAQSLNPAVMHLQNNNFDAYLNLGIDFNQDLITAGTAGEGTLEFWIKSTANGNLWTLTDMNQDDASFSLSMQSNNQLTVKRGSSSHTLDLGVVVGYNLWHHVALSVSNNGQTLELYVNGTKKGQFTLDMSTVKSLYLFKDKTTALMVTEVRGWSKKRTDLHIEENQWRTFLIKSSVELSELKTNDGLEFFYGSDQAQTPGVDAINDLQYVRWKNIQSGSFTARAVGSFKSLTTAEVTSNQTHPVMNLDQILLTATKGAANDKVLLSWPHISGMNRYFIRRGNQSLKEVSAAGFKVSEVITYEDSDILGGMLHTYKVTGEGTDENNNAISKEGSARGFIFPVGEISGDIQTEAGINVRDVEVRASGDILGSAISFASNEGPVKVSRVEAFRGVNPFTVEFWYKGNGNTTPFQLGSAGITFSNGNLIAKNGDGNEYLKAAVANDGAWHHYVVVFSATNGKIYEDNVALIPTVSTSFSIDLGPVDHFKFNAVAPSASYALDEFRVWGTALSDSLVNVRYQHIISGKETDLKLYYRFDLKDGRFVYNQADHTKGRYAGEAAANLTWLASTDQPADLVYGAYTDGNGTYKIEGINIGTNAADVNFSVQPGKPWHTFNPVSKTAKLKSSLIASDYQADVDFTDISAISISGKVLYQVNGQDYPVPAGQRIEVDGVVRTGNGNDPVTDGSGQYSTDSNLGLRTITVENPLRQETMANQSLLFDGVDDYAEMEKSATFGAKGTWSGWIKRGTSSEALQTILQMGKIKLVLKNNQHLALMEADTELTVASNSVPDEWTFFALTYDQSNGQMTLYVEQSPFAASGNIAAADLSTKLVLGAEKVTTPTRFFQGNMHLIEYRDEQYDNVQVEQIRTGGLITADASHLKISYAFHENDQNDQRSVSLTPNGHQYVLTRNGAGIDTQTVHAAYKRSAKYEYRAVGILKDPNNSSAYRFNVIKPENLNFYNDTRYGLVGNLVIPCGYNIGRWNIRVERTDGSAPVVVKNSDNEIDAVFNDNYTVFTITDLLPGMYKVYLENVADPTIRLESGIVDLKNGWKLQEFNYQNPLQLAADVVKVVDNMETQQSNNNVLLKLTTSAYDKNAGYCTSNQNPNGPFYILEQQKGYIMSLHAYELYGQDKCTIDNVQYTMDDGFGPVIVNPRNFGKDSLLFQADAPNFSAPHTKSMIIAVKKSGEEPSINDPSLTLKAIVTGTQQTESDFTLEAPPQIMAVVHDPPGDKSYATLEQSTTYSFTETMTNAGGGDFDFHVSAGSDLEHYQGAWFGVGAGTVLLNKVVDNESGSGLTVTESFKLGGGSTTSYEVSTNRKYSTRADGIPGIENDVYIGYSPVIHVGTGHQLNMNGCQTDYQQNLQVVRPGRKPFFSLTHSNIKSTIIPNLKIIRDGFVNQPDSVALYQSHIDGWNQILTNNETLQANTNAQPNFTLKNSETDKTVEFDNSVVFRGGAASTYKLTSKNTNGNNNSQYTNTSISKSFSKSFTIYGFRINLETDIKGYHEYSRNSSNSDDNSTAYSFHLDDQHSGDQLDVLVRTDNSHTIATPVFKAVAGRTMCPVEPGTQPRIKAQIGYDKISAAADLDEAAIFNLTMRNIQDAQEENTPNTRKSFKFRVLDAKGAEVRLGSGLLSESGVTFDLDATGNGKEKNFLLKIRRDPSAPEVLAFQGLKFVLGPACSYPNSGLSATEIAVHDTLTVSAYFLRPCVERIDMVLPTSNWVVNKQSSNKLPFKFNFHNKAASFSSLKVEYRSSGTSEVNLLSEITKENLGAVGNDGYYALEVDVSGISDGSYDFRLTPQCGTGPESWRSKTSTDWFAGNISRTDPRILTVTPAESSVSENSDVMVTYDKELNAASVNALNMALRGKLAGVDYTPKSAEFDTNTDLMTIPDTEALDLAGDYTIEFWINPSSYANNGDKVPLISKGNNFGIFLRSDGKVDNGRGVSTRSLPLFKWTHVAVVCDTTSRVVTTYFDSEEVSVTQQAVLFQTNDTEMTIGSINNGDAFKGAIDEIRIWSTTRSLARINTFRDQMMVGNEQQLNAYYPLDDNAGPGEGIRDFVGNTSGTVATGITWVENEAAAPMKSETVIRDIPIDVVLVGDRSISISPKSNYPKVNLEGAELMVFIKDAKIIDRYGNKALGAGWSFVYDKNTIRWTRNNVPVKNLSLQQNEGVKTAFSVDLDSDNIQNVTYTLIDLPVWLKVAGNGNTQGNLTGLFTKTIDFEIAEWLNPGIHAADVKALITGDNGRLGVESFYLEVNVTCESPNYTFNPNQYAAAMPLKGALSVNGKTSEDQNDMVAAYLNNSLRGVGSISQIGEKHILSMNIFGNPGETGALTFRVWDASECKEYQGVVESYNFSTSLSHGTNANPVPLTTGNTVVKTLPVVAGYQWVSFNLKDVGQSTLSPSALSGFSNNDEIISQSGDKATFDGTSWIGSLTALDHKAHYHVKVANAGTIQFKGEEVNINTDIPITAGVQWVGYLPDEMLLTNRAMMSLRNTAQGNQYEILGREGSASFSAGIWTGDLTHLTPNRGYQVNATVQSEPTVYLNYYGVAGQSGARMESQPEPPIMALKGVAANLGWSVNGNLYPEVMYIRGRLSGDIDLDETYLIGAFAGDEFRGIAVPQKIDDQWVYFMTLYGNGQEESLHFQVMDQNGVQRYQVKQRLPFTGGQPVGSVQAPYVWELGNESAVAKGHEISVYPNPTEVVTTIAYHLAERASVRVNIVDLTGKPVKTLIQSDQDAGNQKLTWLCDDESGHSVASGIYMIQISIDGQTEYRRLVVK